MRESPSVSHTSERGEDCCDSCETGSLPEGATIVCLIRKGLLHAGQPYPQENNRVELRRARNVNPLGVRLKTVRLKCEQSGHSRTPLAFSFH